MEILRFLLSFLVDEFGLDDFEDLKGFLSGDTDLRTFLNGLTPDKFAPLIRRVFSEKNNNPSETTSEGLTPIENFADKDIVFALNGYFAEA